MPLTALPPNIIHTVIAEGALAHTRKSIEIIDAYAATTTGITGVDAELNGLYGFMLVN